MHCVKCGKLLEEDEINCIQCGHNNSSFLSKLKTKKCKYCNSIIQRKAKICLNCKRIQNDATVFTVTAILLIILVVTLIVTIIDIRHINYTSLLINTIYNF